VNEVIIQLTDVVKRYGSGSSTTTAIDGLSLDIARGEFVSLMGPSGSGKTTLLNLIAGLDLPDRGRVFVNETDLSTLADHELADMRLRTIGFVFQAFNLLPAMTVERNVAWPLQFAGYARAEVRRRTIDALRRVGVTNYERRWPAEMSGGEQQRVAIARAIATSPSILLADEPTGNLDSRTGQAILDLLTTLNRSDGVTIVMVTHSTLAAAYGDRTLELHDGRIARDVRTPPEEPRLAIVSTDSRR
jgi:putative ABC transport system ATP-binding protein